MGAINSLLLLPILILTCCFVCVWVWQKEKEDGVNEMECCFEQLDFQTSLVQTVLELLITTTCVHNIQP
uniref:Uncharacterized protein n=1 Tax=Caenorhabditis brenneri TaxID=135651 RepID=B6VBF0_CAEBE|nr:hypothetical protein Cbre_JD07.010 [Caenorhabditis brenneri]